MLELEHKEGKDEKMEMEAEVEKISALDIAENNRDFTLPAAISSATTLVALAYNSDAANAAVWISAVGSSADGSPIARGQLNGYDGSSKARATKEQFLKYHASTNLL